MRSTLDRHTFDRLVLDNLPAMQRFAIRLTGDVHLAEDVVQDALLRAHRSWQTFRGEAKFMTWLLRIVVNCFRDRTTTRSASQRLAGELKEDVRDAKASDPSDAMQSREFGERVAMEVSRLPPRQREVLVLIAYEQVAIADVAVVAGVSEQDVRTNLHLARERLRARLAKYVNA
jgi:RNA polymerase sigma-70 factor, ECF subfamily